MQNFLHEVSMHEDAEFGTSKINIILTDKSFVQSTNEVTFSFLVAHQYENGIFRNKTL